MRRHPHGPGGVKDRRTPEGRAHRVREAIGQVGTPHPHGPEVEPVPTETGEDRRHARLMVAKRRMDFEASVTRNGLWAPDTDYPEGSVGAKVAELLADFRGLETCLAEGRR